MRKGSGESIFARVAWAAAALALASVLCFVPLFDLIGYELALAVTPLVATAAIQLGLRRVARTRAARSFSARELADLRPLRSLLAMAGRALTDTLPTLGVPLLVLGLNSLRVRNCNLGIGVVWYLALPVASAVYGATLGTALGVVCPRLTTPRRSLFAALGVTAIAFGWCLHRLYFAPPIFVFDPLLGYFAGSLYDEHVAVPAALWWARAYHLALAAASLSIAALWLDGHALAARLRAARGRAGTASVAALALFAGLAGYTAGPRLGYRHDSRTIAAALGGERVTEHFVLHFRSDGPYGKEIADYGDELELRHARLETLLGVRPPGRVHAYLFASAAEKQSLMGAGRTYIAKPWRREIYVNHEAFPQPVLGHELAHVFGAEAGDALLGIARAGLRIDVGLIEGLAEATTWHGGALTADEAVRVLDLLGRRPPLDRVMSPAFWSLPAQQAYAIAGSFCRFLLDRGGAPGLLTLYRAGGERAAYATIYGADFATLEAQWLDRIHAVQVDTATLERERDRILRPSIFRRPCARELARLMELARASASAGDHQRARALYAQVCADEPDDPGHLDELLGEAARADARVETKAIAARLLAHPKASASQRGAVHAVLGDLDARVEDFAAAAIEYAQAERDPPDEATSRLYTVKRTLTERLAAGVDPILRKALTLALSGVSRASPDPAEDYARITRAATMAPADPLLAYLAARQLHGRGLDEEADGMLRRALAAPLPDTRFVRETERLRAEIAFHRHAYLDAAARFDALATSGSAAARIDAAQWADRARFFAARDPGRASPR